MHESPLNLLFGKFKSQVLGVSFLTYIYGCLWMQLASKKKKKKKIGFIPSVVRK